MNKDDALFEFDAPKTFVNLYEIANANYDGADRIFGKSSRVFNRSYQMLVSNKNASTIIIT